MRPRLILHIGMHKTGTTTLQNLMEKQREALCEQGIWYARTDRPPHEHLPKHTSLRAALGRDDGQFPKELRILIDELAASGCDTLLLSEEGLSVPFMQKPRVQRRLARLAKAFDIEAICFVRRQDTWAESLWTQRCREGVTDHHITEFVKSPLIRNHMEYLPMLEAWGRLAELKVIGYEQATARGLVASFTEATGVPLVGQGLYNPGTSFKAAAMMAALRRKGFKDFEWQTIEKATRKGWRRTALGSRLRAEILKGLAAHNAELERIHGVAFPTNMPWEPGKALPEPTDAAVARLARRLSLKHAGASAAE